MNEPDPRASRRGDQPVTNADAPARLLRRDRIIGRVIVAAVLVVPTTIAVTTSRWWGCNFTPGDQAAAVAAYQKDPAFSLAPPGGRLVEEKSQTRACDYRSGSWAREESAGPEFATVWRQYAVDRKYAMDELVVLVGPDVEAAGWHPTIQPGSVFLRYCKEINKMSARLEVSSIADGGPDRTASFTVRIEGRPNNADCDRS
ncbi:hypothetical protein [Micromonospora echinofusca]|uniref:DUF3558 domain-containing protein n=1 Tax=Micromonospora echinofusca TaxID=47858 RepID=A0ABS3VXJ0_MICEH|nr:hypothetical protein [Micromonospora echinofusca]MBO4209266.1 hypothetical protein [Micromonospora echinofusca]